MKSKFSNVAEFEIRTRDRLLSLLCKARSLKPESYPRVKLTKCHFLVVHTVKCIKHVVRLVFIQRENSAVMIKPGYEAKQKIVSDEKRLGPENCIQCLFYLSSEHAQVSNKVVLFSLLLVGDSNPSLAFAIVCLLLCQQ